MSSYTVLKPHDDVIRLTVSYQPLTSAALGGVALVLDKAKGGGGTPMDSVHPVATAKLVKMGSRISFGVYGLSRSKGQGHFFGMVKG